MNIKDFDSIEDFWQYITSEEKWYLKFSPHQFTDIEKYIQKLAQLIIESTNALRVKMEFTYEEYWKIIDWDNVVIREDINANSKFKLDENLKFKQYCSNCNSTIGFQQRHPKTICRNCRAEISDKNGRKLDFFNTEALGSGCQGYYSDSQQTEKYNSDLCYINGKEYFAEEGRFGGIVIQRKE